MFDGCVVKYIIDLFGGCSHGGNGGGTYVI